MVMNTKIQNYRNAQIHGYSSLPDEWKHETSGSNKQDLKVLAFFRIIIDEYLFVSHAHAHICVWIV